VVWGCALALVVAGRRRALETGEPGPSDEPEAVPTASLGAVLVGVAVASIMFGLAFGRFLIYFGAGLLITSLGVVARELLAERRERRRWLQADQR
jgi:Na+/H+-translocating membrane pyrophosphatase